MPRLRNSATLHREISAAERIPYTAHVARSVVRIVYGNYVQAFRLGAASFESIDDEALNNWHKRLKSL